MKGDEGHQRLAAGLVASDQAQLPVQLMDPAVERVAGFGRDC